MLQTGPCYKTNNHIPGTFLNHNRDSLPWTHREDLYLERQLDDHRHFRIRDAAILLARSQRNVIQKLQSKGLIQSHQKSGVLMVRITVFAFNAIKTKKGGITKRQAHALGYDWPLKRGWWQSLIGKSLPLDQYLWLSKSGVRLQPNCPTNELN